MSRAIADTTIVTPSDALRHHAESRARLARHCPPEAPHAKPGEEIEVRRPNGEFESFDAARGRARAREHAERRRERRLTIGRAGERTKDVKRFCEEAHRAVKRLRDAAEASSAAREASARTKKAGKGRKRRTAIEEDDIEMETHRAVTLERAIESLMPSVPSVEEDAGRARNHRGTGAKNHQLTFQEEAQKAEKARLMTKHLSEQTAMAPLASMREVELEHKQLEARDYKRALLRKEVDVTQVMWKARELFDCEVGGVRHDAAATPTGEEAMIWIELYHPVKQGYLLMDVIVRGSTPLAAFKDMIYCLRDVQAAREGHPPSKNGFLFIEGVFYNDMRTPGATDYSEHLIEFQKKNALMAPGAPVKMNNEGKGFTARDMEGVKFSQVPLTIGRPYVMTHQGKCEHKWRVRDVRMPHSDDETRNEMFPLVIREGRVYRRGCSVCGVFDSSHVTYGDKLAAESPSFFCKLCFDAVHCDVDGKLMYNDFEDYQYDHE